MGISAWRGHNAATRWDWAKHLPSPLPARVPPRLERPLAYAIAGMCVVLATLLNLILVDEVAGQFTVFLFYSLAVFGSAQYGRGPGLLAAFAGVLLGWLLFLPPARTVEFSGSSLLLGGLFLLQSLVIVYMVSSLEGALRRDRVQQAELESLAAELRTAGREKDQFLSMLSHELRGGLHGMSMRTEAILHKDDWPGPRVALPLIGEVSEEAHRLAAVLDDMLLLARSEGAGSPRELEPCHLGRFLREAMGRLSSTVTPVDVLVAVDDSLPLVDTVPNYLEQVVWNLVTNAEKYGAHAGPVEVRAAEVGGRVQLAVLDRGPGVPEDELESIFQPYFRSTKTAALPGFGMGLPVVARLCKAMDATVEAHLRDGGGMEMDVSLPICAAVED